MRTRRAARRHFALRFLSISALCHLVSGQRERRKLRASKHADGRRSSARSNRRFSLDAPFTEQKRRHFANKAEQLSASFVASPTPNDPIFFSKKHGLNKTNRHQPTIAKQPRAIDGVGDARPQPRSAGSRRRDEGYAGANPRQTVGFAAGDAPNGARSHANDSFCIAIFFRDGRSLLSEFTRWRRFGFLDPTSRPLTCRESSSRR